MVCLYLSEGVLDMRAWRDQYVGGSWESSSGEDLIRVVSPHTEQVLASVVAASPADVDRAVAAARAAVDGGEWSGSTAEERIDIVRRLIAAYAARKTEMADLITDEIGAPTTFAQRAQVGLPLAMMAALADLAQGYPWDETRAGAFGGELRVRREPVGVVAAIVPWNMPQFLIVTKLIPALLAGCAVLLKPAPESPLDALLLAEIVDGLDLPVGVLSVLPGGRDVGEWLVAHPGVDKVSFTGSTSAGRRVAAACGAGLKSVSLELGGKSAAIALDDARPADVATAVRFASLSNSGQICNALTRVLVPSTRAAEYEQVLADTMTALTVGDPHDAATDVGPLVSARQQASVRERITTAVEEGARVVVGGAHQPSGLDRGWYVQPTLFADVDNRMRIAQEEVFGPVLALIPYDDETEAVRIANDSEYGLAGSVFTADLDRGLSVAARVRTGTFGVNQGYSMDPAAPFGGVKGSGYGRELGREGIDGYVTTKSISVAAAPGA
jgi:acyl-CoA reductase-like NAD-dependent aldehyde dehydrogenase